MGIHQYLWQENRGYNLKDHIIVWEVASSFSLIENIEAHRGGGSKSMDPH